MVTVLGSLNMDLSIQTGRLPQPGETVLAEDICINPGGKGANQAVAAALLGTSVCLLGKVGRDRYGDSLLEKTRQSGVDVSQVERCDQPTGMAVVAVDRSGENSIIVAPGANSSVDEAYIARHAQALSKSRYLLAQQEIPMRTVACALRLAKQAGAITILNPAPSREGYLEMLRYVDILIPNEHELAQISGMETATDEQVLLAGRRLCALGVSVVIVTMGERGAALITPDSARVYPGYPVKVTDTTAAGDSFLGGFVFALERGCGVEQAVDVGQRTGSLTVQRRGAQTAFPTLGELSAWMKDSPLFCRAE